MSLCWLSPAQRPSLRELRIMLLHLRSTREELDTSTLADFDRKWNQLMPRHAAIGMPTFRPVIVDSIDDSDGDMEFSLDDKRTLSSFAQKSSSNDMQFSMMAPVHGGGLVPMLSTGPVRPASFDSEFSSELNASLLAQAGSLQASLRSFSISPSDTPDDFTVGDGVAPSASRIPRFSFSANETSLAAELGTVKESASFEIVPFSEDAGRITGSTDTLSEESKDDGQSKKSDHKSPDNGNPGSNSDTDGFVVEDEDWREFTASPLPSVDKPPANGSNQPDYVVAESSIATSGVKESPDRTSNDSKEPIEASFFILGNHQENGHSPAKSTELASPTKSTNSSADWCMVSGNASEHSKEDESDNLSRITGHSLLSDAPPPASEKVDGDRHPTGSPLPDCVPDIAPASSDS